MYKKDIKRRTSTYGFKDFIKDNDVYNSRLLYFLQNPDIKREEYIISRYEYRPDLISLDFYGTADLQGFLILQAHMGIDGFTRGTVLQLIPKDYIDNFINNI